MIFKLEPFRKAHEQTVQELYEEDGINSIALYCAVSFCPVLAAYWYCREKYPEDKELSRRIQSVMVFYGVERVE